jgi:hypothetical protein
MECVRISWWDARVKAWTVWTIEVVNESGMLRVECVVFVSPPVVGVPTASNLLAYASSPTLPLVPEGAYGGFFFERIRTLNPETYKLTAGAFLFFPCSAKTLIVRVFGFRFSMLLFPLAA